MAFVSPARCSPHAPTTLLWQALHALFWKVYVLDSGAIYGILRLFLGSGEHSSTALHWMGRQGGGACGGGARRPRRARSHSSRSACSLVAAARRAWLFRHRHSTKAKQMIGTQ